MRVRYWMTVYPYHMEEGSQFKPLVSTMPTTAPEGVKVLVFDVFVPDDLFGAMLTATEIVHNTTKKE